MFADIATIANPENYGLAYATCQAEKLAKADLLMFTNPDIIFNSTLQHMMDYADQHPEQEVMAPSLTSDIKGNYYNVPHFHRFPFLLGFMFGWQLDKRFGKFLTKHYQSWPRKGHSFELSATGPPEDFDDSKAYGACCVLIRRSALEKIGGFYNPHYFLAFSDADWGMRVGLHHIKGGAVKGAEVYHFGGGSMKKLSRQFNHYILGKDQGRFEKDWGHWGLRFILYFLDTILLAIMARGRYTESLENRILYLKGWASW